MKTRTVLVGVQRDSHLGTEVRVHVARLPSSYPTRGTPPRPPDREAEEPAVVHSYRREAALSCQMRAGLEMPTGTRETTRTNLRNTTLNGRHQAPDRAHQQTPGT